MSATLAMGLLVGVLVPQGRHGCTARASRLQEFASSLGHRADHGQSSQHHDGCRCIGMSCSTVLNAGPVSDGPDSAAPLLAGLGVTLLIPDPPSAVASAFLLPFATAPPARPALM